ncbi:MAG: hypothetical protein JSW62_04330 [Thermoplasmatales archaeon]|nr:MAG: hypothetical protein JSW62_04330 [Thermoplasmatales archaeon]
MFETTKVILKENTRNLLKKINEAPVLYFIFTCMIIFSIMVFAYTTYFLSVIDIGLNISLEDVFFTIFFVFMLKTIADFYNNFVKSQPVSYSLSTQISQKRTIFEIFLAIFLTQLISWFTFSSLFLLTAVVFRIDIFYPLEYMFFTLGIIAAVFIGGSFSINFFSTKRFNLIPTLILLGFIFQSRTILFVVLIIPLAMLQTSWSITNGMSSYLFSKRKERIKERSQVKIRNIIKTQFFRETTVLWREKLLMSFIFTSIISGFFSGYFYLYGEEILIPEVIRRSVSGFLPAMFVFLGIYVVVIYTAVFPSLNLFLNEEKTMWIIRHLPVKNETIIYGKTSSLALCFITSIPFVPYISIFLGLDRIVFLFWLLIFSYIAGVIISVPLGVKYVGKKSDIMLLYSVAMILFAVLGTMATLGSMIEESFKYPILLYSLILLVEILTLFVSLKISSNILSLDNT